MTITEFINITTLTKPLTMRSFLFVIAVFFAATNLSAQCGTCTPDSGCVLSPAYPTLCPDALPDATVGEFYETDITFYTPLEFFEVENGVDVVFNQLTITGTTGLPFGMNVEMNEPSGIYLPSESEHGCARICGTPVSPGTYTVNINFVATVFVPSFGVEVNQNQSFQLELTVLPGSGGNNSFTFDVNTGCDSLFVNFEAMLNAAPTPTSWLWDFGNGQTSDQQFPPTQFYGDTGYYEVTLETQFLEYVITDVTVNSVNGNWCGDAEEPTCDGIFGILPDIYFQIRDAGGNVLYQSGSVDNTLSANWSMLSVIASNPPYTIQIWDEDEISANDDLGTFSFNITGEGNISFSGAGGTSGSLSVTTQAGDTFFDSEIISVFPSPSPLLEFNETTGTLSVLSDSTLVGYNWYLNDELIPGENGPSLITAEPGEYYVEVQNGFGCSALSEVYVVCPEAELDYDAENGILSSIGNFDAYQWFHAGEAIEGATMPFLIVEEYGWYFLSAEADFGCTIISDSLLVCPYIEIALSDDGSTLSVPEGFASYQWVSAGIPISGANESTYTPSSGGTYWVVITTDYGCTISTPTFISTVSVEENALSEKHFTLYPNPVLDGFNLKAPTNIKGELEIYLTDHSGRIIRRYAQLNAANLQSQYFDVSGIGSGPYHLILSDGSQQVSLRLIIR